MWHIHDGKTEVLGEKAVPLPLSTQIPYVLMWFLTQATALRLATVKGTCRLQTMVVSIINFVP